MAEGTTTRQDEAAGWFAAARAGVMLVEQREAFQRWLSDPRNQAAYEAIEELWDDLAVLKGEAPRPREAGMRQRLIAAAAAVVLVFGISGATLMGWFSDPTIQTAVGQQKTQSLPDGSLIAVNVDSSVSYAFESGQRTVRLTSGEAAFTVKADASRPFVVDTGGYLIRAVGTAFNVRKRDQQIEVAVSEGKVDICSAAGDVLASLSAGQLLRFPTHQGEAHIVDLQPVPVEPEHIAEWRVRVVSYENATVEEVVTDFNRYFNEKLTVQGSELQDRRVTVRLQVEQRDKAMELLASLLDAEVRSSGQRDVLVEQ